MDKNFYSQKLSKDEITFSAFWAIWRISSENRPQSRNLLEKLSEKLILSRKKIMSFKEKSQWSVNKWSMIIVRREKLLLGQISWCGH